MANYFIIGGDGKAYGPVSEAQLREWITAGRVAAQSQVREEGASEWKLLADFPQFQDAVKVPVPPPMPVGASKTSGLAVTSLVLGILGAFTCGLTSVFGLITGIVAMVKIKNSRGAVGGNGFALAGTIVSAVFLFLIPVFAAMMLPALAAAKQKAQLITCINNEKQLALAMRIYAGDNGDHLPPAATWCDAIKGSVGSDKVFKCVAANPSSPCGYAFNSKLAGLEEGKIDPRTVMLFESDGGWNANGGSELMIDRSRHARMIVVAFADGSVQQLRQTQLGTLRWDP